MESLDMNYVPSNNHGVQIVHKPFLKKNGRQNGTRLT